MNFANATSRTSAVVPIDTGLAVKVLIEVLDDS